MNKKICFFVIIVISIFLCGCSYNEIDDMLQSKIQDTKDIFVSEPPIDKIDVIDDGEQSLSSKDDLDEQENVPKERIMVLNNGEKIQIKGIGESYANYIKYMANDNEYINGKEGVSFTLDNVTVFDSFYEAGLDTYGLLYEDEEMLKGNSFILVDMTAEYIASSAENLEVIVDTSEIIPKYLEEVGNASYVTEDRKSITNMEPISIWFSHRPSIDDERLDYNHQFSSFYIKDGEKISFQIGIIAGKEFIEENNVFLMIGYMAFGYSENYTHKFFELFPQTLE